MWTKFTRRNQVAVPKSTVVKVEASKPAKEMVKIDGELIRKLYGMPQFINGKTVYIDPVTKKPRSQEEVVNEIQASRE